MKKTTHYLYSTWKEMKSRCNNPKRKDYKHYGGRGIKVCQEWSNNFWIFVENMGDRPENMTLDRINNDKGYFKDNCKWSSKQEQMLNRRSTGKYPRGVAWNGRRFISRITIDGKRKHIAVHKTIADARASYVDTYRTHYGQEPPY